MICTVPYVAVGPTRHHPLLSIAFENGDFRQERLGVVDSGADGILIPYSLGCGLGLALPEESEMRSGRGIGGSITHVPREVTMYLANDDTKEIYEFREKVDWNYPNVADKKRMDELEAKLLDLRNRAAMVPSGSPMGAKMKAQFESARSEYIGLTRALETNLLLGRTFFHNFEEIAFRQNDRDTESSCVIVYKVREGMPVKIHQMVAESVAA